MTINNESDGYNFIIVILAGTISFLYYSNDYIQNTALNIYEYSILCGLISLAIIILIAYFIYFIIKGFSMEVQDENYEKFKSIATKIHLINIVAFTFYIILLSLMFITIAISPFENPLINLLFTFLLLMFFVLLLHISIKKKYIPIDDSSVDFLLKTLKISFRGLFKIIFFIIFLWVILLIGLNYFYQGNIELEMNQIYYKNDNPIPVLFEVTGPDSQFEITLFNITSNNLTEMWTIKNLGRIYFNDSQKTVFISNDLLVASSLGNGKYNIFINTTNLPPGYYQLRCSRQKFDKNSEASGFYILDYKNE